MGKVRATIIGDESLEKKQHEKAEKRKEAKKLAKGESAVISNASEKSPETEISRHDVPRDDKTDEIATSPEAPRDDEHVKEIQASEKKVASAPKKKSPRGKKYLASAKLVDKAKLYKVADALKLLDEIHLGKFDETVELHINTLIQGVSGQMTLPHGTGKQTKVAMLNPTADAKAAEALLKEIESGKITFDILVATPDAMPKLAKVAKILGPKGLMPNPKNGTITPKPEEVAKKFANGQMYFKTEAKAPIIHLTIGKLSFGHEKLAENINTALVAVKSANIKNVTVKSTMSPGIKLQVK